MAAAGNFVFRRVRGRVIRMRVGATAAAVGAGAYAASKAGKNPSCDGPHMGYQAAAVGATLAAAAVSAFPLKGRKGFVASQVASFGLDALGTALNAASVKDMKGSRTDKLKAFGKAEIRNHIIGYSAWGAGLLANPNVRSKVAGWAAKFTSRAAPKAPLLLGAPL